MVKPCPKEMKCDVEVTQNLAQLFIVEKLAKTLSAPCSL